MSFGDLVRDLSSLFKPSRRTCTREDGWPPLSSALRSPRGSGGVTFGTWCSIQKSLSSALSFTMFVFMLSVCLTSAFLVLTSFCFGNEFPISTKNREKTNMRMKILVSSTIFSNAKVLRMANKTDQAKIFECHDSRDNKPGSAVLVTNLNKLRTPTCI